MWSGVSIKAKPTGELISLASLKQRLSVDHADDDGMLGAFLKAAIARIDGPSGIGYALMEQTWSKSMDCFPSCIHLPGSPVKSVVSLRYVDEDGREQTLDPALYRVDVTREPARVTPAFGLSWPTSQSVIGAVIVDYQIGESDADAVLEDLVAAVCMIVAHLYNNREATSSADLQAVPFGAQWIMNEHVRSHAAS